MQKVNTHLSGPEPTHSACSQTPFLSPFTSGSPQAPAKDWEKPSIIVSTCLKKKKNSSRLTLSLSLPIIVSNFYKPIRERIHYGHRRSLLLQLLQIVFDIKRKNTSILALLATSAQEKPKNQVSLILQVSVTNHLPSVFHLQTQLQFLVLSISSTKCLVNMELRSLCCTHL